MKVFVRKLGPLVLTVLLAVLVTACSSNDGPPEGDTPAPPALEGVFSSELGTLSFNGDGRSIVLDLTEEFAEAKKRLTGFEI